jgi:hypothetical protein
MVRVTGIQDGAMISPVQQFSSYFWFNTIKFQRGFFELVGDEDVFGRRREHLNERGTAKSARCISIKVQN